MGLAHLHDGALAELSFDLSDCQVQRALAIVIFSHVMSFVGKLSGRGSLIGSIVLRKLEILF